MNELCQIWNENIFVHYVLFGVLGPIVSVITIFLIRNRIVAKYWPKALSIFTLLNLGSCVASGKIHFGCEKLLFGELNDDPGDIGIIMLTIPLFLICVVAGLIALHYIKKRLDHFS